jgi:DNA-binding FadR family transcriptional regulator
MRAVDNVTRELRRSLAAGDWAEGDRFWTFDQLMAKYPAVLLNIYRVKAALAPLIAEGLLESQQGSGTWVRRLPPRTEGTNTPARRQLVEEILADVTALHAKVEELRALL